MGGRRSEGLGGAASGDNESDQEAGMKIARGLSVAGVFAVTLLGQAPPRDVDGWGKIKWGMTLADARQAYVIDRNEDNNIWTQLLTQPVDVGDITMKVSIGARHGSDQVSRVRLWMNFGLRDSAPLASAKDFDTLKILLIQKYGPPVDGETKTDGTDAVRTFWWAFPSTSITLTLSQAQKCGGRIELDYLATDQKALDTL
jgi:hypothetical protein